jgi:hypothetical protein
MQRRKNLFTVRRELFEMGSKVQVIPNGVSLQEFMAGKSSGPATDAEDMTSADYYADSYGHFGIHGTTILVFSFR